MKLLHIAGRKNHGKTALAVEIVAALRKRGLRIGVIKHSTENLELDTPGKDTYRHRHIGAAPVALVAGKGITIFQERAEHPYAQLDSCFSSCDLVLVEGDVAGPGPKIEVWRAVMGQAPLALERNDILAIVTDDFVAAPVPLWPRSDVDLVAARVTQLAREV